jgi:hypothetical protein
MTAPLAEAVHELIGLVVGLGGAIGWQAPPPADSGGLEHRQLFVITQVFVISCGDDPGAGADGADGVRGIDSAGQ